jgi:hypothetical protein
MFNFRNFSDYVSITGRGRRGGVKELLFRS